MGIFCAHVELWTQSSTIFFKKFFWKNIFRIIRKICDGSAFIIGLNYILYKKFIYNLQNVPFPQWKNNELSVYHPITFCHGPGITCYTTSSSITFKMTLSSFLPFLKQTLQSFITYKMTPPLPPPPIPPWIVG